MVRFVCVDESTGIVCLASIDPCVRIVGRAIRAAVNTAHGRKNDMDCRDSLAMLATHLRAFSAETLNEILAQLCIVSDVRMCVRTIVLATGTFNEIRTGWYFARNQIMRVGTRGVLAASIEESSRKRESDDEKE